ncbi:MAG: helix-turn-helix domain-containing protein [Clostridia bacterium]|nr:helix-turn-helix domain-containing protein [Clostridia bacterium]
MKSISYPVFQRGRIYHYHHRINKKFTEENFVYHHHPFFEIYLFMDGEAEFIIEETVYKLSKEDIMIVQPYKFHAPIPTPGVRFERIVLNPFPSFFSEMHCENYQEILFKASLNPRICAADAENFNLLSVIYSIDKYFNDDYTNKNIITSAKIIELLYNLYFITESAQINEKNSETKVKDTIVSEVMKYINENFKDITDVSSVTDIFHYSKNYLNSIFQKNMGVSIAKYVNIKRFENVEKLYRQGLSLEKAGIESGFNSYRHFAYAYKKEYGISPKNGLKT